ncbi:SDR family oxidoreductase [Paenibacillus macerans]|uniref:SDR family oxidoreductase n=1 Tax=Paenibacillus macerans TaxID=44252 RepID=UPI003D311427
MKTIVDLFGYKGKNVVITGSASGMSRAATELLIAFGANVYAIDRSDIDLPVYEAIKGDLANKNTIDMAIAELPKTIDALFVCHGMALIKGKEKLIQLVNFIGQRYIVETLLPRIADGGSVSFISSSGGYGWESKMSLISEILACPTFEAQSNWVDEHLEIFSDGYSSDAYCFSKQCLNAYVKSKVRSEEFIGRKIRINAVAPSYTTSGLTKDFNLAVSQDGSEESGEQLMHDLFLKSWNGRPGKPEEMGYPLVVVGSDICSYLSGQIIYIDFGLTGETDYNNALQNV